MLISREPEEAVRWWLAFHPKRGEWWAERFIPGRYSHVSAFSYLAGPKVWVLVEQSPRAQSRVLVWPDWGDVDVPAGLAHWTADCGILVADVRPRAGFRLRLGVSCVEAVKDLIGCRSRALSPEGLWRDLVRTGTARIVHYGLNEGAGAEAGPCPGSSTAAAAG